MKNKVESIDEKQKLKWLTYFSSWQFPLGIGIEALVKDDYFNLESLENNKNQLHQEIEEFLARIEENEANRVWE